VAYFYSFIVIESARPKPTVPARQWSLGKI